MRRKAKIAASMLLAAGLIAGCSTQSGVAATVNGETITVQEVDEGMALSPFYATPPAPANILTSLIQARAMTDAAKAGGIGVSAADAAAFLDSIGAQTIQVDGSYTEPVLDLTRMTLISERVDPDTDQGQELIETINEYMASAEIDFNPRYGSWEIAEGGLNQSLPAWIQY